MIFKKKTELKWRESWINEYKELGLKGQGLFEQYVILYLILL